MTSSGSDPFPNEPQAGSSGSSDDPQDVSPPADSYAASSGEPASASEPASAAPERARNMLPGRSRRRFGAERLLMRLIATAGIVGIGVVIAAILAANKVQGWIIGLAVAVVSVALSAVLWSSRQL